MPYLYTDEQIQIRNEVRRALTATASRPRLRELLERLAAYDEPVWATAVEMGWPAMSVPEANDGLGLGLIDVLVVAEECGRALMGAPFLASGFAVVHALKSAGAAADQRLAAIATGQAKAALAFGEDSELLPARLSARLEGERLQGVKTAVLGAASADFALVLAQAEGAPSLAIVELNGPGVERRPLETIDNSRGLADLRFDGAPAERLPSNAALPLARECLARLALHLAAEGVGGADDCIGLARDYANTRVAFGQPIGKFQAVKHAIAELWVLNEMARAAVLDAAVRLERGDKDAEAYVAAARLNAVQAYEAAAAGATQVHGGIGVTWEADLHLHYRRSRAIAAEGGSAAYWEDRIVSTLEAA